VNNNSCSGWRHLQRAKNLLSECCFYRNSCCAELKTVMLHVAMDNLLKRGRKHFFSAILLLFLFWKWDILEYIRLLKGDVRRLCREVDLIPDVYSAQRLAFINTFLEYLCLASSEITLFFASKENPNISTVDVNCAL